MEWDKKKDHDKEWDKKKDHDKEWDKKKDHDKECNCCIKIEDSLVIIICGEVDHDKLKDSFKDSKVVLGFEDIAKLFNNR